MRRRLAAVVVVLGLGGGLSAATLLRSPSSGTASGPPPAAAAPLVVPAAPPAVVVAAPRKVAARRKPRPKRAVVRSRPSTKPTHVAVVHRTPAPAPVKHTVRVSPPKPKPVVRTETPTQRGRRVLASLHYNWQRLGYKIVFTSERKGYLGYTDGTTKTVTIWIRSSETDVVLAHTIAHELGHVLDFTHGNDAKHALYLSLRGMSPTTPWYGCNGCTDFRTPAGDWAEVFAYWLAGPGDFRSEMGPPPGKAKMAAIAALYKI